MRLALEFAVPLLAGLLCLAAIAAPTSGLGVGENVPAFQVKAVTGEKAGQQLCYV